MNFQQQMKLRHMLVSLAAALSLILAPIAYAVDVVIPDGTTVYLATKKSIVGKKDETAIGDIVPAIVWRDVVVGGKVVISGGTRAMAQVSAISSRKVFGIKGKMSLAAVETSTVDGQTVHLTGGYNKEGKSRMGVSLGIGIILFWPALFVPGKAAELPAGTVMDSYTSGSISVDVGGSEAPRAAINLKSMASGLSVEVLYDKLMEEEKPKYFDFLITTDLDVPNEFVIDVVNNSPIKPISLEVLSVELDANGEERLIRANVKIKKLVKEFKKGINTFEVSYIDGEEKFSDEVILNIEI